MMRFRGVIRTMLAMALVGAAASAAATEASDLDAKVQRWTAAMNAGDMRAFYAACAPTVAVVDGFPPYAWHSCQAWMRDYDANNRRTHAARGTLSIGAPLWTDITPDKALLTYAATFTNVQAGTPTTYRGMWAVTLVRTARGWLIAGSGSAWRTD